MMMMMITFAYVVCSNKYLMFVAIFCSKEWTLVLVIMKV